MPDLRELFSEKISLLSNKRNLGGGADEFISEINYINWVRIRILSILLLVIFLTLFIIDLINVSNNKWQDSIGYAILTIDHFILISFLTSIQIVLKKRNPDGPNAIVGFHRFTNNFILYFVFFCCMFLSIGDMLAFGSLAAYLGTSFAYASIFVMTTSFSIMLYASNMVFMIIALVLIHLNFGISTENQIINTVSFSVIAWFMSRVFYYYSLKDFVNRRLISNQNREIRDQNETNEELIKELRSALSEVKTLQGFLPICAKCKKIRDDKGYWQQLEIYIQDRSDAAFTHGICPECIKNMYPDLADKVLEKKGKKE